MIPPCLTLSDIRYISRVKWSNPGKGVAPSLTPRCSSYWKESLLVALNYSRQLYLTYLVQVPLLSLPFLECLMLALQNLQHKFNSVHISMHPNPVCFYLHPKLKILPSENFFHHHEKALDLTIQNLSDYKTFDFSCTRQ